MKRILNGFSWSGHSPKTKNIVRVSMILSETNPPTADLVSLDTMSVSVLDATLTARAISNGRTTWDESDICALLNCEMPQ